MRVAIDQLPLPIPTAIRRRGTKASDQEIADAYRDVGSCWKVAELLGMCGQSVHERLTKLRIIKPINVFSTPEIELLKREYWVHADAGRLPALAFAMGRPKTSICRMARELGLTDKKYNATWKYVSEENARKIFDLFKRSSLGLGKYCATKGYDDRGFSVCMRKYFSDEYEHVIEAKQPAQTMYRIGRAFEYRVRDALKMAGYFVTRSPASKSPIDLVAVRAGSIAFIQCKRSPQLGVVEWNQIFALAETTGAIPVLATMPKARGMELWRLTGRKDGSKRRQPMTPWTP